MNTMNAASTTKFYLLLLVSIAPSCLWALKFEIPKELREEVAEQKAAEAAELEAEYETLQGGETEAVEPAEATMEFVVEATAVEAEPVDTAPAAVESVEAAPAEEVTPEEVAALGRIAGQVFDKETGQPLRGVAIVVADTDFGTISDSQGRYRLSKIPVGSYTLSFIKSGFLEANITDTVVVAGEVKKLDFAMPPRPVDMSDEVYELQDFTVSADEVVSQNVALLALRQQSIASIDALSSEDFSKFAASDVAEAVTKMSGASLSDGKYVVMRGLNDRYNTVLINGVRLPSPDPDRKAIALDIFPTSMIRSVIARKTYTSDMPGDSSGGSVELLTKSIPEESFFKLSYGIGRQESKGASSTFLADPEQVDLEGWLKGEDSRGYSNAGRSLISGYGQSVGEVNFPSMIPIERKLPNWGDRSLSFSMGGSKALNNQVTAGAIFGTKISTKRRSSFKEFHKSVIKDGLLEPDVFAYKEDGKGTLKSEEEYSYSTLLGFGLGISDHTNLNYNFLHTKTLSSTVERSDYEKFYTSEPVFGNGPGNYDLIDVELASEDRELRAHQFSGEHKFTLVRGIESDLNWYHTKAFMGQLEPDRRIIGEFIPTQSTVNPGDTGFSTDPGLPPVARFQRETQQNSIMFGGQVDSSARVGAWTLNWSLGFDSEESSRDFLQLESLIDDNKVSIYDQDFSKLQYAAMPVAQISASGQAYQISTGAGALPGDNYENSGLEWYADDFTEADQLIRHLYTENIANIQPEIDILQTSISGLDNRVNTATANYTTSVTALENAATLWNGSVQGVNPFDPRKADPGDANYDSVYLQNYINGLTPVNAGFFDFFVRGNLNTVESNYQGLLDVQDARANDPAVQQQNNLQQDKTTLETELANYVAEADNFLALISQAPALAIDPTQFPTFNLFGDEQYILETPAGFTLHGDSSPTLNTLQFPLVDGKFQARGIEEVRSFFASGDIKQEDILFFDSIRFALGLRHESNYLNYELLENDPGEPNPVSRVGGGTSPRVVAAKPIEQDDQQYYFNFSFELLENLKLSVSHSKTIAKPTFREIAPFPIFNLSDRSFEIGNSGLTLRSDGQYDDWLNRTGDFDPISAPLGDADPSVQKRFVLPLDFAGLEITDVESHDLRLEFFTPLDGLVSVGYFKKTIEAPIERTFAYDVNGVPVNTFINNNNDASLDGVEFELQQNLGFLEEHLMFIAPLSWITLGGNYTLIDAEVERSDFEKSGLSSSNAFVNNLIDPKVFTEGSYSTRPLYDQPEYTANAFIKLDIEPTGTSLTLSQNWIGRQLDRVGGLDSAGRGAPDLFWDPFNSLNFVLEQNLREHWKLRFSIKNLGSPTRKMSENKDFFDALNVADADRPPFRSSVSIDPSYSITLSGSF